jgi:glutamine amidotransferase
MCRLVLYIGPEITLDVLTTRPVNSIVHQSFQSRLRKEPLNGDGFGVVWYVPEISEEPAQFRSIQPAWNNVNLINLARVSRSAVILAHVRAATDGMGVSQANCHPFTAGQFAFMHNGSIAEFGRLKRRVSEKLSDECYSWIQGTTDSEHLFALFCDHYARRCSTETTEAMAAALVATINDVSVLTADAGVTDASYLNLAVTDGKHAVVSRCATGAAGSPSLYTSTGRPCVCDDGICRMIPCSEQHASIIVASEPLNDGPEWKPVPHNHFVLIYSGRTSQVRPLASFQ